MFSSHNKQFSSREGKLIWVRDRTPRISQDVRNLLRSNQISTITAETRVRNSASLGTECFKHSFTSTLKTGQNIKERNMARLAGFKCNLPNFEEWVKQHEVEKMSEDQRVRISVLSKKKVSSTGEPKRGRGRPKKNPSPGTSKDVPPETEEVVKGDEPALNELLNLIELDDQQHDDDVGNDTTDQTDDDQEEGYNTPEKISKKVMRKPLSRRGVPIKALSAGRMTKVYLPRNTQVQLVPGGNVSHIKEDNSHSNTRQKVTLAMISEEEMKSLGRQHGAMVRSKGELMQLFENLLILRNGVTPTLDEIKQINVEDLPGLNSPQWIVNLRKFGVSESEISTLIHMGIITERRLNKNNIVELKGRLGPVLTNTLLDFIDLESSAEKTIETNREDNYLREHPTRNYHEQRNHEQYYRPIRDNQSVYYDTPRSMGYHMPNLPPYRKGRDKAIDWLRDVRHKLEYSLCDDIFKTLSLKQALGGELLQSWDRIKQTHPDIGWQELIERLSATAAPVSTIYESYSTWALMQYKYGDNIDKYFEDWYERLYLFYPEADDKFIKETLQLGMPFDIKMAAIKAKPPNSEELKIVIKQQLQLLDEEKRRKRDVNRPSSPSKSRNDNSSRFGNNYNRESARRMDNHSNGRMYYRNQNDNRKELKCHHCGGPHLSFTCKLRAAALRRETPANDKAEVAKTVNADKNETAETVNEQTTAVKEVQNLLDETNKASLQFEETPVNQTVSPGIKLKIYDKGQCIYENIVLCDSGSPVSIISERIIEKLSCEIYKSTTTLTGIVNGVQLPVLGYLYLCMKLNECENAKPIKFLVTSQKDIGVLLGTNFTYAFDAYPKWRSPINSVKHYSVQFEGIDEPKGDHILHLRPLNEFELDRIKKRYYEQEGVLLSPIKNYGAIIKQVTESDEEFELESDFNGKEVENHEDDPSLGDLILKTINPQLSHQQKLELWNLMWEFSDIFARTNNDLGCVPHSETQIVIPLKGRVPYKNPYACTPERRIEFQKVINEMIDSSIIQKSASPGGAPALLVRKKDGNHRLVVDFRELNKVVMKTPGPMPRIEDSMAALAGNQYFTVLDLNQGYYQLEIPPDERWKTAFTTPDGKYEFCRLPMGYTDAPYEFQMLINKMLDGLMYKHCLGYFDDLISFGKDWTEHLNNTRLLFERIRKYGLKAKTSKCQAGITSTVFLGHIVDGKGIRPNPKKVEAIKIMQYPTTVKQLRSNLGLFTFLSRYVPNYSKIIEPLLKLIKKGVKFEFGEEQKAAFETIRSALIKDCMLVHFNPTAMLKLSTDASDNAVGGILLQEEKEEENAEVKSYWRPISYYSQTLMKYQQHYTVSEKELLAIIVGILKFHHYLSDREFIVETDHHALCQLPHLTFKSGRLNRWALVLQGYNFKVIHVKGNDHASDCLTRNCEWLHRKPIDLPTEIQETIFNLNELNTELDEFELLGWTNEVHRNEPLSCDHIVSAIQLPTSIESKVASMQDRDKTLRKLRKMLMLPQTYRQKELLKRFKIIRGVIYRCRDYYHPNDRIVISEEMFEHIFEEYHNKREGGHFGIAKTYETISERYWKDNLKELITQKVMNCKLCAYYKGVQAKFNEPQCKGIPDTPLVKLELDVAGPLRKSENGNQYVLIAVDTLSRYIFATPTSNQTARTVISFLEIIIYQYGVPKIIQSDQGTNFTSSEFADFCQKYQITHRLSSPYHPQSNGLVERMNRTLGEKIKIYCDGKSTSKWDSELNKIVFGINTTIHTVTRFSPFYLLYGFHPRRAIDNKNNVLLANTNILKDRQLAKERLEKNQETLANKAMARRANYQIGDLILVQSKAPNARGKKLKGNFSGPYIVLEYEKGHVKVVPLLEEATISQFNVSNTKRYMSELTVKEEKRIKELCQKYGIPFYESTSAETTELSPDTNDHCDDHNNLIRHINFTKINYVRLKENKILRISKSKEMSKTDKSKVEFLNEIPRIDSNYHYTVKVDNFPRKINFSLRNHY